MTPDERAMVDFVLRWSSFDDGDEYILPEFGLTPTTFYRRVLALLAAPTDELDISTCSLLRDICRAKVQRPIRRPHPAAASRTDLSSLPATAKRLS
ncbi:DUF3263 domain-containing protein (plasmid) [Rhodococcus rhodochrous]|uniref:DUF3263 domain-containing protein n=1 Tax=Rhodococcus rhodochrous TaxID=1829 RepID=UPI00132EE87A|nr:DUF3263 domain-containing protein [Rhodococcus rhodochrous]QHG85525.1 DUF3263 domain-containing protein [Rhodococcus rhodochrous]